MINMLLSEKLQKILALREEAGKKGCTRAELMMARDLTAEARVRLKCRFNTCGNYGRNLMCPPHVPGLDEAAQIFANYTFALVLQVTSPMSSTDYRDVFAKLKNDFNEIIIALEKEAFRQGFVLASGFSGGTCTLCEACAGKESPIACRFPDQARPSMEAMGLDVGAVCRHLGLPADFLPGEATLTGLLLID